MADRLEAEKILMLNSEGGRAVLNMEMTIDASKQSYQKT